MRAPIAALTAAVALLGATGCGATHTIGSHGQLQIALKEYSVTPQSVVSRSGAIAIEVHNYGRLTHNLVITLDGTAQAGTNPIPPGQSTWLFVSLGPGRYLMASTIRSDQALGAYGTLIVGRSGGG